MSWPLLEVKDNSGFATIRLTIGHPPGSTFRVGYHVIKYDAQDSAGNKAYPCVFTVKIEGKNISIYCVSTIIVLCSKNDSPKRMDNTNTPTEMFYISLEGK